MSVTASPAADTRATADRLAAWIAPHRRVFVLTGAGCSTASGIPDYRGADGAWKQRRPPVTYQAFVDDPATRARYWARSFVGWPRIVDARPNATHHALAGWQARGGVSMLVTQNVDGLHQRAGSAATLALHGNLDRVRCLGCGARTRRDALQGELARRNPAWSMRTAAAAPDGDADLDHADLAGFRSPRCRDCDGLLKPDVVFFGETVPRERVAAAHDALQGSDAMLVVGSSLMVYSGYRFARMARDAGQPLAILTRGVTRADDLADLKLDAECGATLAAAIACLRPPAGPPVAGTG